MPRQICVRPARTRRRWLVSGTLRVPVPSRSRAAGRVLDRLDAAWTGVGARQIRATAIRELARYALTGPRRGSTRCSWEATSSPACQFRSIGIPSYPRLMSWMEMRTAINHLSGTEVVPAGGTFFDARPSHVVHFVTPTPARAVDFLVVPQPQPTERAQTQGRTIKEWISVGARARGRNCSTDSVCNLPSDADALHGPSISPEFWRIPGHVSSG